MSETDDPFAALTWTFRRPAWHERARRRAVDLLRRAVCAVRGHRMEWHGGVVDWETGETDGECACTRCGRPDGYHG